MFRRDATYGIQPYAYAVLGGLLSSQCCVIQLALNAMSVGCAGFSALTPYRPAFLAATTAGLVLSHRKYGPFSWLTLVFG